MIDKHWHCSYCGDAITPGDTAYMRIEYLKNPCILCPACAQERKPGGTIDWAKLPEWMLEKQAFAKQMGIEFDKDGIPILRKRTPTEQMVYYQTKYALWQVEKRVLTEKLEIAVQALEFISRECVTTSSGKGRTASSLTALNALDEIKAVGKESDDG